MPLRTLVQEQHHFNQLRNILSSSYQYDNTTKKWYHIGADKVKVDLSATDPTCAEDQIIEAIWNFAYDTGYKQACNNLREMIKDI